MQKLLGKELKIRSVPRVHFFLDKSVEEGVELVNRIETLAGVKKSSDDVEETEAADDTHGESEE